MRNSKKIQACVAFIRYCSLDLKNVCYNFIRHLIYIIESDKFN